MFTLAQSRTNDDCGDGRLLEHVAAGHVGDADVVPVGNGAGGAEHALQAFPATGSVNESPVLHL